MKTIIKYVAIVFICVSAVMLVLATTLDNIKNEPQYMYTVMEYSGKVAVYKFGDSEPNELLDVYVESLPKYDRDMLKKGIKIESDEQLQALIEDYDG